MAAVTLKAGLNIVVYTGTTPLTIGAAPFTATNVRFIYKVSPNQQGYVTKAVGSQVSPFGQLLATEAGRLPQGYVIFALRDFEVDGAQFGIVTPTSPDTLVFTAGASDPLVTLFQPVTQTTRVTLSGSVTAGSATLDFSLNGGGYATLAATNTAIASASTPYTLTARLSRTSTTAATATITVTY